MGMLFFDCRAMGDYSNYMWSVRDWRTDEMYVVLDNREQGIYRNLIDECWVSGSISNDMEILARFVHEPLDYFVQVWSKIRHKFRSLSNGKMTSSRLLEDPRRLTTARQQARNKASTAAKARWNKVRQEKELHAQPMLGALLEAPQIQIQIQKEGERNGEESSLPEDLSTPENNSKTEDPSFANSKPKFAKYRPEFLKFWELSTRRGSKVDAQREWTKLKPDEVLQAEITSGMADWRKSEQWQDETKQPHISRWLKRGGWEEIVPSSNGHRPETDAIRIERAEKRAKEIFGK